MAVQYRVVYQKGQVRVASVQRKQAKGLFQIYIYGTLLHECLKLLPTLILLCWHAHGIGCINNAKPALETRLVFTALYDQ